ncbi:MAG: hypothetical protein WDM80_17415 [Limisphaerales bacterium]
MKQASIILGIVVAFAVVASLGYFIGRVQESIRWSWVPKEHVVISSSMQRIEQALKQGDTGAVLQAVGAYNQKANGVTNEFDYMLAAMMLWDSSNLWASVTNKP